MAFEADSDYKLMMMQLNDPPPAPSSIQSDVPASIDRIVLRAMEKKAENRFASAAAFRAALQDALRDTPVPVDPPRAARSLPATRFADNAVPVPPPPVSVSGAAPATRLAEPQGAATRGGDTRPLPVTDERPRSTLGKSPSVSRSDRLSPNARERLRDWRTWLIAASLFAAGGMLALAMKPSTSVAERAAADSTSVTANASATLAAATVITTPDTTAASTVVMPPQPDPAPPPRQIAPRTIAEVRRETPRKQQPDRNRAKDATVGAGDSSDRDRHSIDSAKTAAPPIDPPKEVKVAAPTGAEPEESAESARGAMIAGIGAFVSAVNSGSAAEVDRLLRGPERPRSMLLSLVREGRLTMSSQHDGTPAVAGGEASVPFEARMSWRTPFGSVRRNTMPMMAEFSRSGRTWRLNSVRILRPVDFR